MSAVIHDDSEKKFSFEVRQRKALQNYKFIVTVLSSINILFCGKTQQGMNPNIGVHCSMNNEKPWKLTSTMTVMLWVMVPDFLTLSANCSPSFTITAVSTKLTDNWPDASDSKLDSKIIWLIRTLKFKIKFPGSSWHEQNYLVHQNTETYSKINWLISILKFTVNLNYLALKSMKFTVKLSSSSEHSHLQ